MANIIHFLRIALAKKIFGINNGSVQVLIKNQYSIMKALKCLPSLNDVGFREFSQFEEDGLLLYIFSVIGETNKKVVEICCGTGDECMAANLIINHGWDGLLFDGSDKRVEACRTFFSNHKNTNLLCPPRICCAWITKDNVNQLIHDNGIEGEIDLLSLDIDGNDYWVMEEINVVNPRVIICETHSFIPDNLAYTAPYIENFSRENRTEYPNFYGASTFAMKLLLEKKGYRLVGAHRFGGNCIFMRNDVGKEFFPEVSVEDVHKHRYIKEFGSRHWEKVRNCPWIDVSRQL